MVYFLHPRGAARKLAPSVTAPRLGALGPRPKAFMSSPRVAVLRCPWKPTAPARPLRLTFRFVRSSAFAQRCSGSCDTCGIFLFSAGSSWGETPRRLHFTPSFHYFVGSAAEVALKEPETFSNFLGGFSAIAQCRFSQLIISAVHVTLPKCCAVIFYKQ